MTAAEALAEMRAVKSPALVGEETLRRWADAIEAEVVRCTCPVGFGAVVDPACKRHGVRKPLHTITGAFC